MIPKEGSMLAPEPSSSGESIGKSASTGFQELSHLLDVRLLRALAHLGFSHPTPVQSAVLPLALSGSDILARAQTGSGKTLAYGLPILQKVLLAKKAIANSNLSYQVTRALVLVPTRELSEQVTGQLSALLPHLQKDIKIVNVARDASKSVHKVLLAERPDIVVSTPSRAYDHIVKNESLSLQHLETMAFDEADLILSYGHDEVVRSLLTSGVIPKSIQCLCMSATMTQDVKALRGLVLKKPAVLDIPDPELSTLTQYSVHVSSAADKFLLIYVLLRLRLIRGKSIIFLNDIDRGYRLKLFLEQFGVKSTVLNEELPVNSRYHIVQEFNKGLYDYIIATDESRFGADAAEHPSTKDKEKKQKEQKKDTEYGVSRGVDFVSVSCVVNFDLPVSSRGYTHRVGRTARAGKTGTSLSFVVPEEVFEKDTQIGSHTRHLVCKTSENDSKVWQDIVSQEGSRGQHISEWKFDNKQIEAFRYRMEDALRSVTKHAIREARVRELKHELLTSDRLKAHFEDNPTDLDYLRHDKVLHSSRQQPHLKHIPAYLMPRIRGVQQKRSSHDEASNDFHDTKRPRRGVHTTKRPYPKGQNRNGTNKKSDPLHSFRR